MKDKIDNETEITLDMVMGIDKIEDGEYLISYSSAYSETPEYDTVSREVVAQILKNANVSKEYFYQNIVPYLSNEEAVLMFDEILDDSKKIVSNTEKVYEYGMRSRPFSLGTFPKNDDFVGVTEGKEVEGTGYYNILQYGAPLSREDIERFQLDDFTNALKGGKRWEDTLKTINYLIKTNKEEKYLTAPFYKQIDATEDIFFKMLHKNGYDDPIDLYDELVEKYQSQNDVINDVMTDISYDNENKQHQDKGDSILSQMKNIEISERMKEALSEIMISPNPKAIKRYLEENKDYTRELHPMKPGVIYALALSVDPDSLFSAYSRTHLNENDIKDYEAFIKKQYAVSIMPQAETQDSKSNIRDVYLFRAINEIKEYYQKKYISKDIPNLKTTCSDNIENCIGLILMDSPFPVNGKEISYEQKKLLKERLDMGHNYAKAVGDNSLAQVFFNMNEKDMDRDEMRRIATYITSIPALKDEELKNGFANYVMDNYGYVKKEGSPISVNISKNLTLHAYPDYSTWGTNKDGNHANVPSSLAFSFIEELKKRETDFFQPIDNFVSVDKINPTGTHFNTKRYRKHEDCLLMDNKIIEDEMYVNVGKNGVITPNKYKEADLMVVLAPKQEGGGHYYMNGNNLNNIQGKVVEALFAPKNWELKTEMSFLNNEIQDARKKLGIHGREDGEQNSQKLEEMAHTYRQVNKPKAVLRP